MPPKKVVPKKKPAGKSLVLITDFDLNGVDNQSVFVDAVSSVPNGFQIPDSPPKPIQAPERRQVAVSQNPKDDQMLSPEMIVLEKALAKPAPVLASSPVPEPQKQIQKVVQQTKPSQPQQPPQAAVPEPEANIDQITVSLEFKPSQPKPAKKTAKAAPKPIKKPVPVLTNLTSTQSAGPANQTLETDPATSKSYDVPVTGASIQNVSIGNKLNEIMQITQEDGIVSNTPIKQSHVNNVSLTNSQNIGLMSSGKEIGDDKLLDLQRWPHSFIEKKLSKDDLMSPESGKCILQTLEIAEKSPLKLDEQPTVIADTAVIIEDIQILNVGVLKSKKKETKAPPKKAKTTNKVVILDPIVDIQNSASTSKIDQMLTESPKRSEADMQEIPTQPTQVAAEEQKIEAVPNLNSEFHKKESIQQPQPVALQPQQQSTRPQDKNLPTPIPSISAQTETVPVEQPQVIQEEIVVNFSVPAAKTKKKAPQKGKKKVANTPLVLIDTTEPVVQEKPIVEQPFQNEPVKQNPIQPTLITQQIEEQKVFETKAQTQQYARVQKKPEPEPPVEIRKAESAFPAPSQPIAEIAPITPVIPVQAIEFELAPVQFKNPVKKATKKETKHKAKPNQVLLNVQVEEPVLPEPKPISTPQPQIPQPVLVDNNASLTPITPIVKQPVQTQAKQTRNTTTYEQPKSVPKEQIFERLVKVVELKPLEDEESQILRESICMLKQDILSRRIERPVYRVNYRPQSHIGPYIDQNVRLKQQLKTRKAA